jgi:uncharacterized protein
LRPWAALHTLSERSGWRGGTPPGAADPRQVAKAALAALGRRRTLVLSPVSGTLLSAPALARAALAQGLTCLMPRR